MNKPLVSVVIVVKDGERFLGAALDSVFGQAYQPYEVIVVDGQSNDRTADIAKAYTSIRYILQVNRGISDAYNVGIDAAQGEFVAFLSHDDLWTPDKLSSQIGFMLNNPDLQYTVTRFNYFLEAGCAIPPGFREELLEGDHIGQLMETLVARKSVFDTVGKFDTELDIGEDADWYARANDYAISMAVIPKVLLHKRVHQANTSLNAPENNRNLLKILRHSIHRKRSQQGHD